MLDDKVKELNAIKQEMQEIMTYKNEIFDLKTKVAELQEEINRKDTERDL